MGVDLSYSVQTRGRQAYTVKADRIVLDAGGGSVTSKQCAISSERGFSLLEMVIAVAITLILASFAVSPANTPALRSR